MDVSKFGSDLNPDTVLSQENAAANLSESPVNESSSEILVEVASLTGLPVEWVQTELTQIVKNSGHTPEQLTLEELRASMLEYLEEMNREMMAQESADLDLLDSMPLSSDISH